MGTKKPKWVVEKERGRKADATQSVWLFGIHAVRDALANPKREKLRLIVTRNAADRLAPEIAAAGLTPELTEPRKFSAPIDSQSVHQGAALEVHGLDWGRLDEIAEPGNEEPLLLLLDRVTDPHNVGAILRSAEVFGARAVIAPHRHSAPETGALAKSASGALERQPYLRVPNLGNAMETLHNMGYLLLGLAGEGDTSLEEGLSRAKNIPLALVLGAEGPGLRARTRALCDAVVRITAATEFASLNVSNAAAVALYAAGQR